MGRALLLLTALGLLTSYAGSLHPAGDSLAVLRPAFIAALILLAPFVGRLWGLAGLALVLISAPPILWSFRGGSAHADGLRVYQKNLRYDLADPAPVIADIQRSSADLVLLQEVSDRNLAVAAVLEETHPYQLFCPAHSVGAVAVLSRLPFAGQELCEDQTGLAAVLVETAEGPLSVAVLHLYWPWPHGQAWQLDGLIKRLEALPRPIVVGGDFNMVPWGHAVRRVSEATGAHPVGPLRLTFFRMPIYPLPIDHVLAPDGWIGHAETRPELGSDHRGVLVRLSPPGP